MSPPKPLNSCWSSNGKDLRASAHRSWALPSGFVAVGSAATDTGPMVTRFSWRAQRPPGLTVLTILRSTSNCLTTCSARGEEGIIKAPGGQISK